MGFSQDLVAVYTEKSTPLGHVKLKMLTPGHLIHYNRAFKLNILTPVGYLTHSDEACKIKYLDSCKVFSKVFNSLHGGI